MRTGNQGFNGSDIGLTIAGGGLGGQRFRPRSLDRDAVERLLRRTLRADRGAATLRRLLARTHFRPANIHLMTDEEVLRTLTRLVSVGEIQVTETRWWTNGASRREGAGGDTGSATTGGKAIQSSAAIEEDRRDRRMRSTTTPADRPFPPPSQQPDPKNWIEFQLVDHETDEPIANVPFRIALPDGAVAEHTSDGNGMIRIDDLPPGYCDIQEILDKGAFEVVGIA